MPFPTGNECKLYRLSTGTRASWGSKTDGVATASAPASLDEVPNVQDLTINLGKSEAEFSSRASAFKLTRGTLIETSVEFAIPFESSNADYEAFRKAFLTNTVIACAVLDGDKATTGTTGLWADFEVIDFTHEQPLEEGVMVNVTIKPAPSAVAPEWVKVGS